MPANPLQQSHCNASRLRRACALTALLGLALFQLTLSSHQFQHQGKDLLEVCGVCLQLDRMDDALATAEPAPQAAGASTTIAIEPLYRNPSALAGIYRSRAPPAV